MYDVQLGMDIRASYVKWIDFNPNIDNYSRGQ